MSDPYVGLCASCRHVRRVTNKRGSTFYLCRLADSDPTFAKYPPLPVLACRGFEPVEKPMAEPFYVARASIRKVAGLHRRGVLPGGTAVDFGVHGAIKSHYGLDHVEDMPLPVDYVAAAAGG